MDLIINILLVVTKDLPISPRFTPYDFLSRCKFSTLTTRQPMVEFYLLTFPRFPLRKKEHKSYIGKNRTYDFRTSRCGLPTRPLGRRGHKVETCDLLSIQGKSGNGTKNTRKKQHLQINKRKKKKKNTYGYRGACISKDDTEQRAAASTKAG